jgi:hypothetical protein
MTLEAGEFIRRFLIHVLPDGRSLPRFRRRSRWKAGVGFTAFDTSASSATAIAPGSSRGAGNCSGWSRPNWPPLIHPLTTATASRL